uniref:Uncharacterized protein n=1 Tax=Nymphaea colorata TaxID=210225 RepID=A0A5K1EXY9_9MAGN|nr:unnamed protein product [Nymphaea colorata]
MTPPTFKERRGRGRRRRRKLKKEHTDKMISFLVNLDDIVTPLVGVIHGEARNLGQLDWVVSPTQQSRRVSYRGGSFRHLLQHDRPGPDLSPMADLDVSQHMRTCTNQDPIPNLGVPVAAALSGTAERHVVQDRHIVADDGGLADHGPGSMVQEHPLTDPCTGVDVHGKDLGHPVLDDQRQRHTAGEPQPVSHPVRLDGEEPLEVEHDLNVANAGRVSFLDGLHVLPDRLPDGAIVEKHGEDDLGQVGAGQVGRGEAVPQVGGQCTL